MSTVFWAGDPMNMTILVALVIAFVVIFALKRGIGRLMVKNSLVLSGVGKRALARMPQYVSLQKTEFPKWLHEAAVEQQAAPLRKEGFSDLGVYTVSTIPGVLIRTLAQPQTYVAAHIYDHPKAGIWTELVTRYNDGSSHALSTLPPTGIDHPDWFRRIDADKNTPTDQLYRQFLTQREWHGIKSVAPEDTIREFEENYAKLAAWRQQRGITPQEVSNVATGWLGNRQAAGTNS